MLKKLKHKRVHGETDPSAFACLKFFCVIIIGTIVVALPAATQGPDRFPVIDSLFTATSATCVTGLTARDILVISGANDKIDNL